MNVKDLQEILRDKGLSVREARKAVRGVFRIMKEALIRGERVETPVGILRVRNKRKRPGPRRLSRYKTPKGREYLVMVSRAPRRDFVLEQKLEFREGPDGGSQPWAA